MGIEIDSNDEDDDLVERDREDEQNDVAEPDAPTSIKENEGMSTILDDEPTVGVQGNAGKA